MARWKNNLLSSGIPLEYEVARLVTANGYWTEPDYTYTRDDLGVMKEFSVDVKATSLPEVVKDGAIGAEVVLLLECKYRSDNIRWVFFPVPDDDAAMEPLANPLAAVDHFSSYRLARPRLTRRDPNFVGCYKGVEIDMNTGAVYDKEIRHGLRQLQYALPPLLEGLVSALIQWHPEDNLPFIYCPILVTTAPLHIVRRGVTVQDLRNADQLSDVSEEYRHLVTRVGTGPDFIRHCRTACERLGSLGEIARAREVNARAAKLTRYQQLPLEFGKRIAQADELAVGWLFTRVLVTTYEGLPELLHGINRHIRRLIRGRSELPA